MRKDRTVYILALDYSRYIRSCAKWRAPHRSLIPREVLQKFIRTLYCTLCQLASTIAWMYVCAYRFLLLYSHLCVCVYCYHRYSRKTEIFNFSRRQTITSFHFTRTHFMLIFILLPSLISSSLHFFFLTLFSGLCGFDVV